MTRKPERIGSKKRLEILQDNPANATSQPDVTSPIPPEKELFASHEVPHPQPKPHPKANLKRRPKPKRESVPTLEPKSNDHAAKPTGISQDPPISLPDPQGGRLDYLEQQLRGQKVRGNVALSLALLLLLGFAIMIGRDSGRHGQIIADNFTISDAKGIHRVWIGKREGQVCVELRDHADRRRLSLGLAAADEPRLIFYNKDQKILGEIVPLPEGHTGIRLLNQIGEPVATMPAPSSPAPAVSKPQVITPLPTPNPQPEKVHLETSKAQQELKTKSEDAVKAAKSKFFVANPRGKAYHLPSCPWVKNIPMDNLLKFSAAPEAAKAGYHPCRSCRPNHKD